MTLKVILVLSGLVAAVVGGILLFVRFAFYDSIGIQKELDIGLLNLMRTSGGFLLASGILIILGIFFARLEFTSIVLSTLLYLSYGLSSTVSMITDGQPPDEQILSTILAVVIGLVCVFVLIKYQKTIS